MRHLALLVALLPLLLATTCSEELLRARVEIHPNLWLISISPDGSVAAGQGWLNGTPGAVWKNGATVLLPNWWNWASGISNGGQVLVGGRYRWENGVVTQLSEFSYAHGLSADGRVTVGTYAPPGDSTHWAGMSWSAEGAVPLVTPNGFAAIEAHAVSADGETIAGWGRFPDGHYGRFIWRAGEVTEIELRPGVSSVHFYNLSLSGDGTTVVHTDDTGLVSGCYGDYCSEEIRVFEPFRWRDGVTQPLGSIEGLYPENHAYGVTHNGEVIIGCGEEAFIWDVAHGMRSLDRLIRELGAELPEDATLACALDISADGGRVVGWTWPYGDGFVATLPPACSDRIDNDGDGTTDFPEDRGCGSRFDASEERGPRRR